MRKFINYLSLLPLSIDTGLWCGATCLPPYYQHQLHLPPGFVLTWEEQRKPAHGLNPPDGTLSRSSVAKGPLSTAPPFCFFTSY